MSCGLCLYTFCEIWVYSIDSMNKNIKPIIFYTKLLGIGIGEGGKVGLFSNGREVHCNRITNLAIKFLNTNITNRRF